MSVTLFNDKFLSAFHLKAIENEKRNVNFGLCTTPETTCQLNLNIMEPGTHVSIHRHMKTPETVICLEGCLDWIFYEELPNVDAGGPVHDGRKAIVESNFKEVSRFRICPRKKLYGIQVPPMIWHSIEVHESSTIFEAKNESYGE